MQRPFLAPTYQQPILPQPQKKHAKALVGFGQVPKFIPPAYDGVNPSDLPCPETPSPRGSLVSNDDNKDNPGVVPGNGNNNTTNWKQAARGGEEQNRASRRAPSGASGANSTNAAAAVAAASTSAGNNNGGSSNMNNNQNNGSNNNDIKPPFPPGSFVEYRSRTMQDRWILAKVEAFDERNRVYKLDVQPKAPWDRVRLRQQTRTAAQEPEPADKPQRAESRQNYQERQSYTEAGGNNNNVEPRVTEQQHPLLQDLHLLTTEQLQKRVVELVSENTSLRRQLEIEKAENALRGGPLGGGGM